MNIQLSEHFTYKKLMRFSVPSIFMMLFTSIYGIVDGFFVSNFAGKTAFAAVNLIFPALMILGCLGFIVGSGGSAIIGKTLGEQDKEKANGIFSMLVYFTIIFSVIIGVIGFVFIKDIALLLGADEEMVDICALYGKIYLVGLPAIMLQYEFQSFFIVAEKPQLGLYVTLAAGFMNMILDGVLVGVFKMGVAGAAAATVASEVVGGVLPLFYFIRKNTSLLRIGKAYRSVTALFRTLGNGASEFVSNISMSVVSMLYNMQLMEYAGENGIAAYGVLMYVGMIFIALFIGYSVGTAPIISYHFGAKNRDELKNLLRKSLVIIGIFAVSMLAAGELFARPFSKLFVGYDEELLEFTVNAFRYYAFTFLFCSIPIFGSSFFTALNDGFTSAAISFLRTVVFQVGAVLLLPKILQVDGIWLSLVAAEIVAAAVTIAFWVAKKKKYGY